MGEIGRDYIPFVSSSSIAALLSSPSCPSSSSSKPVKRIGEGDDAWTEMSSKSNHPRRSVHEIHELADKVVL